MKRRLVLLLVLACNLPLLISAQHLPSASIVTNRVVDTQQMLVDDSPQRFQGVVRGFNKIRRFNFQKGDGDTPDVKLVFDDSYAYISTPDGLFRTGKLLSPDQPLEFIGFAGKYITNLYVYNNTLYVLKAGEQTIGSSAIDHSLLKSSDHGATFVPIDKGLEYCYDGYCQFMTPTQAFFKDNLIFTNAGAGTNVLVTADDGAHWNVVSGIFGTQVCYDPAFTLVGNRFLIGGECPLDNAYLRSAKMRPDFLGLEDPKQLKPPFIPTLGNKNVEFIAQRASSPLVFAGVEGALLKSSDYGESFKYARNVPAYVRLILFPSAYPDLLLIGGYAKGHYFGFSPDNGETWSDATDLIYAPDIVADDIVMLTEDAQGRLLAVLSNSQTKTIIIAEILLAAPSAANPINDATYFVTQHYRDFLNREPDESGLKFWEKEIISCGSDTACTARKRINVSAAYFLSTEFQQTGYLAYRFYKAVFGRVPRYTEFVIDTQTLGYGVVVGSYQWERLLEENKHKYTEAFIERSAFKTLYDNSTPAAYVDALNANVGNILTKAQRDALVSGLANGNETRAGVLRKIAENDNFAQREFNPAFVLMQYFGYLRRNPDDAPDKDLRGYQFWLDKLNRLNGNYEAAEMVKAFISSTEYRQRFGQP